MASKDEVIPLDGIDSPDLERNESRHFLRNHSVQNFSWSGLTVTVKDRQTKQARKLINDICGDVQQGSLGLLLICN